MWFKAIVLLFSRSIFKILSNFLAGYAQPSGLFTPVISTPLSLTPQSAGAGVYAGASTPSGMIGPGML